MGDTGVWREGGGIKRGGELVLDSEVAALNRETARTKAKKNRGETILTLRLAVQRWASTSFAGASVRLGQQ